MTALSPYYPLLPFVPSSYSIGFVILMEVHLRTHFGDSLSDYSVYGERGTISAQKHGETIKSGPRSRDIA